MVAYHELYARDTNRLLARGKVNNSVGKWDSEKK